MLFITTMIAVLALLLYAMVIHPTQTKERMLAKILDTYKFELEHGVPESQSKVAELLKEIGRDEDEGED